MPELRAVVEFAHARGLASVVDNTFLSPVQYRPCEQGFDLVVTVGTTAVFPYIAAPVQLAPRWGARTAEVNPGASAVSELVDLRLNARAAPTFGALAAALGYG